MPDRPAPAVAGSDRLLLLGACVRSLAQSALRGRLTRAAFPGGIVAVDFFGDADLEGEPIEVVGIDRDRGLGRTVANLGRAALTLDWQAVMPAGGLENRPGLLRHLARRGRLLGSDPGSIRAVRDPARLFPWLAGEDLPHAPTPVEQEEPRVSAMPRLSDVPRLSAGPLLSAVPRDGRDYLVKRRRGAGGGGVRAARPGEAIPPGCYVQERLDGRPGSAVFLADGRDAILLGVSEQLVGMAALGAREYRHAGNLVDAGHLLHGPAGLLDDGGVALARRVAAGLAACFALRGLAGFDFIAVRGRPHLIEVNPRWTASMELIEAASGACLFDEHLRVIAGAEAATAAAATAAAAASAPPGGPPHGTSAGPERILGRGVLYAVEAVEAPAPEALAAIGARDRPRAGETMVPGQPICTLTARAVDRDQAIGDLEAGADAARALMAAPGSRRPSRSPAPEARPPLRA